MLHNLLINLSSRSKVFLRSLGQRVGLEIRLSGPSARDDLRLARMLKDHEIEVVLDIGANRGQFASGLLDAGYEGSIVSYEPLPAAHSALQEMARIYGEQWIVAPRFALNNVDGTAIFNVNRADATSSILPASAFGTSTMPGAANTEKIEVETRRLDSLIDELDLKTRRSFIKIDVQGGEGLVFDGAPEALTLASGIVVELSLQELYADQPLAFAIIEHLMGLGFQVYDIYPGYRDRESYQLYQFDAVLFHPDRVARDKAKNNGEP
jgi:FkbM family methyltransferase